MPDRPERALRGTAVGTETQVPWGAQGREALRDSQGLADRARLEIRAPWVSQADQEPLDNQVDERTHTYTCSTHSRIHDTHTHTHPVHTQTHSTHTHI